MDASKLQELTDWLIKDEATNVVRTAAPNIRGAKESRLRFRRLKTGAGLTLLEVTPLTGRSHQIRVQLANAANRCYFCKTEMYARIGEFGRSNGIPAILDGLNVDDLSDRRPGRAAAIEHGVISPLVDAGLTKIEVRELSHQLGLPSWDKPALACLSSRIPHGTPITLQSLSQVDQAESFIKTLGVGQVRVRHYGSSARIEVEPSDFSLLHNHYAQIAVELKAIGFDRVEVDPDGYRTGLSTPSLESISRLQSRTLPVLIPADNAS